MALLNFKAILHGLPNWQTVRKIQAAGETSANGCRATDLFPCDMNIFRPQDFPLASGNTDAAAVNHPALVKTSDQASLL
jgi:hypothetical protein